MITGFGAVHRFSSIGWATIDFFVDGEKWRMRREASHVMVGQLHDGLYEFLGPQSAHLVVYPHELPEDHLKREAEHAWELEMAIRTLEAWDG